MTLSVADRLALIGVQPEPEPVAKPEYVGDEPDVGPRSEESEAIDRILGSLTIVDAYNRWSGKGPVDPGTKTESIMVSCPNPAHPDVHPSAWINTDKDAGNCAVCGGFDQSTIAAWGLGFSVPGYQSKEEFPRLRRQMAEELGLVFVKTPTGTRAAVAEPEPEPNQIDTPLATIVALPSSTTDEPEPTMSVLEWEKIIKPDTFLWDYVMLTGQGDIPDEYNVAMGMVAVALATGPQTRLDDVIAVKGNIFCTLLGDSGSGKSKAAYHLTRLLEAAIPFDRIDPTNDGVYLAPNPGSAEVLVDMHVKVQDDVTNPTAPPRLLSIRSLVEFSEFSELVTKSGRSGSVLKPMLHKFYDAYGPISISSRGHRDVVAETPYCCMVSTTQVKALGRLLTQGDADSGFLNRWLWWMPTMKPLIAIGGPVIDTTTLSASLQRIKSWAGYGHRISLTPGAVKLFEEWFGTFQGTTGEDAPLLSRMNLTMKKLLVIMAANEHAMIIDEELVERTLLFWPYFRDVYAMLGLKIDANIYYEAAELIRKALEEFKAAGVEPSVRDLFERKLKSRIKDREVVIKALAQMEVLGEIEQLAVVKIKGGRPTVRYRLIDNG